MILAYCITPQPQKGGPTAKQFHVHTVDGAIVYSEVVAKRWNPAPSMIEMGLMWKSLIFRVQKLARNFCCVVPRLRARL